MAKITEQIEANVEKTYMRQTNGQIRDSDRTEIKQCTENERKEWEKDRKNIEQINEGIIRLENLERKHNIDIEKDLDTLFERIKKKDKIVENLEKKDKTRDQEINRLRHEMWEMSDYFEDRLWELECESDEKFDCEIVCNRPRDLKGVLKRQSDQIGCNRVSNMTVL